ncbi:Uncharacterised protein [Legionella pneumophila]|nr:Uncharacterised protein [Legionella pneumophila]
MLLRVLSNAAMNSAISISSLKTGTTQEMSFLCFVVLDIMSINVQDKR